MESQVKVHKCEKCNKIYKSKSSLCNHNKRFHKIPIVEQPVPPVPPPAPIAPPLPLVSISNQCEYCKKVLSRIDKLNNHYKICKKKKKLDEIVILKEKIIELESKIQDMKKSNKYYNIIKDNSICKSSEGKPYEEIEKKGYIYIFSTDKPGIVKCGRTNHINNRKCKLQTGTVDEIEVLYGYNTWNDILLEKIVHILLDDYRVNEREYFKCNLEYMKYIIFIAGSYINTIKSSFDSISFEEIKNILIEKLNIGSEVFSNNELDLSSVSTQSIVSSNDSTLFEYIDNM